MSWILEQIPITFFFFLKKIKRRQEWKMSKNHFQIKCHLQDKWNKDTWFLMAPNLIEDKLLGEVRSNLICKIKNAWSFRFKNFLILIHQKKNFLILVYQKIQKDKFFTKKIILFFFFHIYKKGFKFFLKKLFNSFFKKLPKARQYL